MIAPKKGRANRDYNTRRGCSDRSLSVRGDGCEEQKKTCMGFYSTGGTEGIRYLFYSLMIAMEGAIREWMELGDGSLAGAKEVCFPRNEMFKQSSLMSFVIGFCLYWIGVRISNDSYINHFTLELVLDNCMQPPSPQKCRLFFNYIFLKLFRIEKRCFPKKIDLQH